MNGLYILIIRALYIGLFTGIVIAIPMGPAGIESVRWTILYGFRQGFLVAAGSLIADAIDVMLINFGLLDLIETNRHLEVFFWMLSGMVIFYIGYKAVKSHKNFSSQTEEEELKKKEIKSRPLLTGFVVNATNPMTHFFWVTLSSTVLRVWRSAGRLPYFIFAVAMLSGMCLSLAGINYFASKGKKFSTPKLSTKLSSLLSYGIAAIGVGFFLYGLYRLLWI
ncbi:MAG: LysE family transporter [Clostridiales bacterium]|jgi:threonine/homoserine/homoserine lactone efflux protein|nr:LysE family transporter [Eubacteriales bacterium]MDH7567509.1 LysE family transporter [Clostridiales bacterium]